MPELSGATGGGLKARSRHHHRFRITAAAGALLLLPTAAAAAGWPSDYLAAFGRLEQHEKAALALIVGVVFFAVLTAILLVRTRARGGERGGRAR